MKTIFVHIMMILALSLGLSVPVIAADFVTTKLKAEQGHADAQYRLALMYDYGEDIDQDYAQAFKWYQRSANQGYAKAQYNLGWMFDFLPALKDGDSYSQTLKLERKNVFCRINIAVMSDAALAKPLSGKRVVLPQSSPLRTVHESFPSYGSSLYKLSNKSQLLIL